MVRKAQVNKPCAKLARPSYSGICERKRLFARIDRGRKRPVVWIAGQPGAGKTILVSSYLEASGVPFLWYQVDRGDSDLSTFFYYMRLAAARTLPNADRLPLFTPEYAQAAVFARRFFEELFSLAKLPCCLVFDNFQEAGASGQLHEVMREACAAVPEGASVVFISRSAPPAHLARLFAGERVEFIGPKELAFTLAETGSILRLRSRAGHGRREAEDLFRRTKGWAAGLALMLERDRAGDADIGDPRGRQGIFDYFASEIVHHMDSGAKELLLKTSILDEFDAEMAARLTAVPHAGQILASLNRKNYFTERRFASRPVYQYHPLFREFLSTELSASFSAPDRRGLRRRAAALFEEQGRYDKAFEQLRAADDAEGMARVAVKAAPFLLGQGRFSVLRDWIAEVPGEMPRKDPRLLYWLGMSTLPSDPSKARPVFTAAYALFRKKGDPEGLFLAWAGAVDTYICEWKDFSPLDGWIKELGRMRRRFGGFPSPEVEQKVASSMLGALIFRQPDSPELPAWVERSRDIMRSSQASPTSMYIGYHLILYYCWIGRYSSAAVVIKEFSASFESAEPSLPQLMWHFSRALYSFHVSSHPEALGWIERGLEIAERSGIRLVNSMFYGLGVMTSLMGRRDIREAEGLLEKMGSMEPVFFDVVLYHEQAALLALARGRASQALEHIRRSCSQAARVGSPFLEFLAGYIYAYCLVEAGQPAAAKRRLAALRRRNKAIGSVFFEYILCLTEAVVHMKEGERKKCLDRLGRALGLGRENGLRSLAVLMPATSEALLAEAVREGMEPEFTAELISGNHLLCPDPAIEGWPWPVKLFTMGDFELWKDGERVEFPRKARQKPLEMLKAVVALGGRAVSEQAITDALWPEAEGDAAHSAFSTTLHRLRQLVGEGALQLRNGRLTLDARHCWVDAWALDRLLKEAAELTNEKGYAPCTVEAVEKAAAWYRGDFLDSDVEKAWTHRMRDTLRDRTARALGSLASHYLEKGSRTKAQDALLAALGVDDTDEECCRELMLLYMKADRRKEAVSLYRRLSRSLEERHGMEPSSSTKAVLERVLAGKL